LTKSSKTLGDDTVKCSCNSQKGGWLTGCLGNYIWAELQ